MVAIGRVTFVNLDDAELEIAVAWENVGETIRAPADSVQAALVRKAAEDVVATHYAHLESGGYIIGEPPPEE